jgi:hypothetical protein
LAKFNFKNGFQSGSQRSSDKKHDSKHSKEDKYHGQCNGDSNILLGVFDGHNGSMASVYLSQVAVYELFMLPEYQEGKYEKALNKLFLNLHTSLLECPEYKFSSSSHYASGSTASIALITDKWTYFASVGDSPILVASSGPSTSSGSSATASQTYHLGSCHNYLNLECIRNIYNSGINTTITKIDKNTGQRQQVNYNFSPDLFNNNSTMINSSGEEEEGGVPKSLRIGDGLSVFGGIGDAMYDAEMVYNPLLNAMKSFCKLKHEQSDRSRRKLENYIETGKLCSKFRHYFTQKCTSYKRDFICRVINIEKSILPTDSSFLGKLLLRVALSTIDNKDENKNENENGASEVEKPNYLKNDPIIREPFIKAVKNSHCSGFAIFSGGVIEPKLAYTEEPIVDKLIFPLPSGGRHKEEKGEKGEKGNSFENSFNFCSTLVFPSMKLQKFSSTNVNDDRSGFLCWFNDRNHDESTVSSSTKSRRKVKDDGDKKSSKTLKTLKIDKNYEDRKIKDYGKSKKSKKN